MRFNIVKLEDRLAPSGFHGAAPIDISHTDHTFIDIDSHKPVGDINISHTDHTAIDIDAHVRPGSDINIGHTDHTLIVIGGR
jgi:hypothetical protein